MGRLRAPEPLTDQHPINNFDCGHATLNEWLQRRALHNETNGGSRTYVVCDEDGTIAGYYAMAAGSVEHIIASGKVRRNMPDPIPVMVLGRLAVDRNWHRQGVGKGMLKDAVQRTVAASQHIGIRAILVHAISDEAHDYYIQCGFHESPVNSMTLMITLAEALRSLQ